MADPFDGIAPLAVADRLTLAPCPPATRFVFRGAPEIAARAGTAFGVELPREACRARRHEARAALWLGPDEWLLLAPDGSGGDIAARIAAALAGEPHALVEVSDAHAALEVAGPRAEALLAAGCALDLDARSFPVAMCTRTLLAKATIVLWREDAARFRVELRRSFAAYGWRFLVEAAREHRAA